MIDPILASAAEINRAYLIGGGFGLYILFLWNKKLVKRIAKWTISLATLAVAAAYLSDGGFGPGLHKQQVESKPLVQSQYYQDPLARVPPGEAGQ